MKTQHMTLVPSVPVWRQAGQWVLDRKFLDGLCRYAALWPGPMRCLAWLAEGEPPAHGVQRLEASALPCALQLLQPHEAVAEVHLAGTDIVLAAADDHRQLGLAALCRSLGKRCVYVIEYIPETRRQINRIETPNPLLRWRRQLFLDGAERRRRHAFAVCHGLQANGLPAYEHYPHPERLLYFDTRMGLDAMPGPDGLSQRLASMQMGRPLQLAFSGRLIGMKGADHLLPLAAHLREAGLDFRLSIFGTGEMLPLLQAQREQLGLQALVALEGALDFETELVPRIRQGVDLYVMPHRQSDPSCTYLETLACGIPIVGYLNRAFGGLLRQADIGRGAPLDDVAGLAQQILLLAQNREGLARLSRQALAFARRHSMEQVFEQRVQQLRRLVQEAA